MQTPRLSCFFDCDNTLLDNDSLKSNLTQRIHSVIGPVLSQRYWDLYETVRSSVGTVDIPTTFERLRPELSSLQQRQMWDVIWNDRFSHYLYPHAKDALRHMQRLGIQTGIVSDGDMIYQPHKIKASGLASAVKHNVKIYHHKQQHLEEIMHWLPAEKYLMVDDKPSILNDIKRMFPESFITIQVRQGHYATNNDIAGADIILSSIGDLTTLTFEQLLAVSH